MPFCTDIAEYVVQLVIRLHEIYMKAENGKMYVYCL
uniref:Uncharacterized protein n=1 Tax=Anguilla anguilla TaxID=7936 RepID=A0A0E9S9J1_ANGAN